MCDLKKEEKARVCVRPRRRGRELGYVCDLVYRTLGMLLVSDSIP